MLWFLLAGCCGLALINLSVAVRIVQRPRFYGARTGGAVNIYCLSSEKESDNWTWYWSARYNGSAVLLPGSRINVEVSGRGLQMSKLRVADSGLYFCDRGGKRGPGTWVEVARNITLSEALYRTNMKDGLIIFQGLLLAACVAAVFLHKRDLLVQTDIEYEEPETDHIYEGLAIETCGGGDLYEELTVYAQADGAEAPWE
ncbi:B-cell antigen receptor complex-associated protein beta chain [Halichoeres trimaculatus]|uniref:B-cell antigen receptor complex-associated protein beta chain n=1 Tax=Halichoeres trimaculatus TaxID=147232 RepID=UPI003D9DF0B4